MQYDDISQLPPKYQEQVRRKLKERERKTDRAKDTVTAWTETMTKDQWEHLSHNVNSAMPWPIGESPAREPDRKKSKYKNRKTEVDGIPFDSIKESRRFMELREMQRCGAISDLRLQVNFTLIEGYTKPTGERVKPETYKADFTYYRRDENGDFSIYIVEDVKSKGTRTEKYKIKRKQLYDKFHLEITEV